MKLRLGEVALSNLEGTEGRGSVKLGKYKPVEIQSEDLDDGRDGVLITVFVKVVKHQVEHSQKEIFLLSHLHSLGISTSTEVGVCGFFGCTTCFDEENSYQIDKSAFQLSSLFKSLPTPTEREWAVKAEDAKNQRIPGSADNGETNLLILDLPENVLDRVVSFLEPPALRALSATCRYFRMITFKAVPFLRLQLYDHQMAAVNFMVMRESLEARQVEDPYQLTFRGFLAESESNEPMPVSYKLHTIQRIGWPFMEADRPSDCRGGLFCDEPGLGKTITSLALILKTVGIRAQVPKNATVFENGTYITEEEKQRIESQRFEAIGVSPSFTKNGASNVTPKKRRVMRPDFFGDGKSQAVLPSPTKSSLQEHSIYPSKATLVVVPTNLMEHWKNQIELHILPGRFHALLLDSNISLFEARLLSNADLVITTFTRLSMEYTKMRSGESQLLRVHWLRIILDEGHKLGSLGKTDLKTVSNSLRADRRWVMTGTPTPNTPNSDVRHLFPLLTFIREPIYGMDYKVWENAIQRPYETYKKSSADILETLLSRVMIRNEKEKIRQIPKLTVRTKELQLTTFAADQYNEVVEIVQRNLLLAEKFNGDKTHSLLNPINNKACREAITNLRKSCSVAGHIDLRINEEELLETLQQVKERVYGDIVEPNGEHQEVRNDRSSRDEVSVHGHGATHDLARIAKFLTDGGKCTLCSTFCRCPILTPCAHVLCAECVEKSSLYCVKCHEKFELDELGYPEQLIELQPSYTQSHWKTTFNVTTTAKVSYLIDRLNEILTEREWRNGAYRRRNHKIIVFSNYLEHLEIVKTQIAPVLRKLFQDTDNESTAIERRVLNPAPEALEYYMPTNKDNKDLAMMAFRTRGNRPVLLMDVASALGHDLSFVKYIFLMEPIWDRAEELQVISRAHRLGAKEEVVVEKLVGSGTIEATMEREQSEGVQAEASNAQLKKEKENAKKDRILTSLKLLRVEQPRASGEANPKSLRRVTFL